jgi:hypothetical protein
VSLHMIRTVQSDITRRFGVRARLACRLRLEVQALTGGHDEVRTSKRLWWFSRIRKTGVATTRRRAEVRESA